MKNFYNFILLLIFNFLLSCSLYYKQENNTIIYYKIFLKKEKVLVINFDNFYYNINPELLKIFINDFYNFKLYDNKKIKIIHINSNDSLYKLYYKIGLTLLNKIQNPLIKYGLIQYKWSTTLEKLNKNKNFENILSNETYNIIRDKEFDNLFRNNKITKYDLIYNYVVKYLLKNLYFVSIQEISERPYRYLDFSELDSIFFQIIILPEVTQFTKYIIKNYGINKLIKLGLENYDKQKWYKELGIEINELEENFTKEIENMNFEKIYNNTLFYNEFNNLLTLYNKSTKSILFKK